MRVVGFVGMTHHTIRQSSVNRARGERRGHHRTIAFCGVFGDVVKR